MKGARWTGLTELEKRKNQNFHFPVYPDEYPKEWEYPVYEYPYDY